MADKFRTISKNELLCLHTQKRGRVGVKQCMHYFHSNVDCLLGVSFCDYML